MDLKPTILLTGGTGHTGKRLAAALLAEGATLRCLIHTPSHQDRLPESPNIEFHFGSASEEKDIAKALEGIDTVFHIAHIRYAEPVIAALEKRYSPEKPVRLIAMSSTRVLSRFPSETRSAVAKGEATIRESSAAISWCIVRASMIFGGPEDNNIERLGKQLRKSRFFPLFGAGRNLVQPVFVTDLVRALVACRANAAARSKTYTIAGPEAMPYIMMVRMVAKACGARPPVFVHLPVAPSLMIARVLGKIWPRFPVQPEMIERFAENRSFDISEAQHDLGFRPTAFADALQLKYQRAV